MGITVQISKEEYPEDNKYVEHAYRKELDLSQLIFKTTSYYFTMSNNIFSINAIKTSEKLI